MAEVRLICKSPDAAAAVTAEAARVECDTTHTVRREGHTVIIGYHDARWPLDVADWAFSNGHAWDEDAAAVIASLPSGNTGKEAGDGLEASP